ncbi:hypothetical protein [Kurthia sibirica]|uniref:Uncharacterized protein n=1 Tax=Kurthia sibirica TaxID=202750 RepID=A0A2U3AIE3_9BACL|nr:hypothetical protein [Kurthia sibirica]PWI24319.1 hypothetical protein DEX24_13935 [Kurthia sibirica]GEK34395.1 hypothetical protein KSI01_19280 [Kurthia sibirica]
MTNKIFLFNRTQKNSVTLLPGKYGRPITYLFNKIIHYIEMSVSETIMYIRAKHMKNIENFLETKEPFPVNVSYNIIGEGQVFVDEAVDYWHREKASLIDSIDDLQNDYDKFYSLNETNLI